MNLVKQKNSRFLNVHMWYRDINGNKCRLFKSTMKESRADTKFPISASVGNISIDEIKSLYAPGSALMDNTHKEHPQAIKRIQELRELKLRAQK